MSQILLSIESGGSKTLCSIMNEEGDLLGWGKGSSTRLHSDESAKHSFNEAVETAIKQSGISADRISFCVLSVLGQTEALQWVMEMNGIRSDCRNYSEVLVALVASLCRDCGIVALSGTGSFVYGRSVSGDNRLIGGLGYLLGDDGSGFEIGMNGLKAALRWMEGWGEQTILAERIEREWMGVGWPQRAKSDRSRMLMESAVLNYPSHHLKKIAQLNRVVGNCAAEGDAVSLRIIEEAGMKMGLQVAALTNEFKTGMNPVPIGCAGGNWKLGAAFADSFAKTLKERMHNDFVIVSQMLEPLFALSLLGLRELGVDWDDALLEKMQWNNKKIAACVS